MDSIQKFPLFAQYNAEQTATNVYLEVPLTVNVTEGSAQR